MQKVIINYVSYKVGGPQVTDLMGGHVDAMFATMLSAVTYLQGGKLKALLVTDEKRWAALPRVPSAKEAGLAGLYVVNNWPSQKTLNMTGLRPHSQILRTG